MIRYLSARAYLRPHFCETCPTGIKGLVAGAEVKKKLDLVYSDEYLNTWRKLFTDVDFTGTKLIEVSDYNFFPERLPKKIEIVAEIPKLESLISSICLDNRKLYEIHPRDFEELVGEMLRKESWVSITQVTGPLSMIYYSIVSEIKKQIHGRTTN